MLLFKPSRAFESETSLRFFLGFFRARAAEFMTLRRGKPAGGAGTVYDP
jgi:hypothetical protein